MLWTFYQLMDEAYFQDAVIAIILTYCINPKDSILKETKLESPKQIQSLEKALTKRLTINHKKLPENADIYSWGTYIINKIHDNYSTISVDTSTVDQEKSYVYDIESITI